MGASLAELQDNESVSPTSEAEENEKEENDDSSEDRGSDVAGEADDKVVNGSEEVEKTCRRDFVALEKADYASQVQPEHVDDILSHYAIVNPDYVKLHIHSE